MLHFTDGTEKKVNELVMNDITYLSILDAKLVSGWSRAYINKLVNVQSGDKEAKVNGMRINGLGWLVDIEALKIFHATSGRKAGLSTLYTQALMVFLNEKGGEEMIAEWAAIYAKVNADYHAEKEQKNS